MVRDIFPEKNTALKITFFVQTSRTYCKTFFCTDQRCGKLKYLKFGMFKIISKLKKIKNHENK